MSGLCAFWCHATQARSLRAAGCIRTVVINKDGVKRHFLPNHEVLTGLRVRMRMCSRIHSGCSWLLRQQSGV